MLQSIHLYNPEPITYGSKKVPCSALFKFCTYICVQCSALLKFRTLRKFVSKRRRDLLECSNGSNKVGDYTGIW